jgi:predicted RNA-binding Zn-ribbon protein involved in translation (DUF1610 family)
MDEDDDYAGFDTSSDDDDATVACPHCGEMIYDDAERCPECGEYLTREATSNNSQPWWIVMGVAICLLVVLAWTLGC